jgi:hypothetical protein
MPRRIEKKDLAGGQAQGVGTSETYESFTVCDESKRYEFVKYVPSSLETWWNQSIAQVSKDWDGVGCPKVRSDSDKYKAWFTAAVSTEAIAVPDDEPAISYHAYRDLCSKEQALVKVPIEPIMGLLRHPNAVCVSSEEKEIVRKDWLILPSAGHLYAHQRPASVILYDIGASLYKTGFGGASQEWFVQEFAARGMAFDHIYAWEAIKHAPEEIFQDIPRDMLHKIRYYNVAVQQDPQALHNPIRLLKASAKPQDYVVVKLDIDTPWLELALMQQLLADEDAMRLVDELFFEQHTGGSPMTKYGWEHVLDDITDSYALFTELRVRGVRAHSWV